MQLVWLIEAVTSSASTKPGNFVYALLSEDFALGNLLILTAIGYFGPLESCQTNSKWNEKIFILHFADGKIRTTNQLANETRKYQQIKQ